MLTDFFGNHIPVAATPILPILQQAEAGAIVPLAVTSTERIPALKGDPTFRRDRLSGDERRDLVLAGGSERLAEPIVAKLNDEVRRASSPRRRPSRCSEKSALLSMDADFRRR